MYWTEEGKNKVCIRAVSKDGVAGPWSDVVNLYIDLTGPKAEFTHTWADGKDDWHSTNLTLTYKATDAESGLDHFEYTYDDVKAKKAEDIITYNEGTGKLTVQENTEPNRPQLFVFVRAVDKVGNKGEWTQKPAYTNIDMVEPLTPVIKSVDGNNTKTVKLNMEFTDGESLRPSGFGKYIYTMNDTNEGTSNTHTITLPANVSGADKLYDVKVWAEDKAGNRSTGYALQQVAIKPGVRATGVTISRATRDACA